MPLARPDIPETIALLGYSYGAHIAAMLTFKVPQVCALATLGGIGMLEAEEESEERLFENKRYLCFANRDDMIGTNSRAFSNRMAEHSVKVDVIERNGGHMFDDYVENCSARHAFAFLLESSR